MHEIVKASPPCYQPTCIMETHALGNVIYVHLGT